MVVGVYDHLFELEQVPYYLGELIERATEDDRIPVLKASQTKLKVNACFLFGHGLKVFCLAVFQLLSHVLTATYWKLMICRNFFLFVRLWNFYQRRSWKPLVKWVQILPWIVGL